MKPRLNLGDRHRGAQKTPPLDILVQLVPQDLERIELDLDRLADDLLPTAEARLGEALAARHWEQWWHKLHGAGVRTQPPAGARATYAIRHWQVFAGTLTPSERSRLREALLQALELQRMPSGDSDPACELAGQAAHEGSVVLRRVDAAAGLANNPHHDR